MVGDGECAPFGHLSSVVGAYASGECIVRSLDVEGAEEYVPRWGLDVARRHLLPEAELLALRVVERQRQTEASAAEEAHRQARRLERAEAERRAKQEVEEANAAKFGRAESAHERRLVVLGGMSHKVGPACITEALTHVLGEA